MQPYGVVRRRKVDMRCRPVLAEHRGSRSKRLSALKIGGGGAPYLLLLPSRMAGLPVPGDERRSHLEQQRL